jgi:hypothetical protein
MNEHDRKRAKARSAGALKSCRGKTWDRSPSKRKRSKLRCRNRDPRKGGSRDD